MGIHGHMWRMAAVLACTAVLAGACGAGEPAKRSAANDGGQAAKPAARSNAASDGQSANSTPSPATGGGRRDRVTLELWFVRGDRLLQTWRFRSETPRVGTAALRALLAGPQGRYGTAVPAGTELLSLEIRDGVARADFGPEFSAPGQRRSLRARVGQVVFTLTQFPTVRGVRLLEEGAPSPLVGAAGLPEQRPLHRSDFEDLAPPIVVSAPVAGQRVSSPVAVSGTANVFEATVSIRVRDEDDEVVGRTFTTATCGTGCRGQFSAEVAFEVAQAQRGTIEFYEVSAEDGRPLHLVEVPVVLEP